MKKISWTDRVNDGEARRVKEERDILHKIHKGQTIRIGHILRRSVFPKHVIDGKTEGRTEMTRRGGRICKQLLDGFKGNRGY
jgi:hypothetical protein